MTRNEILSSLASGASLHGASLQLADLRLANLNGADLSGADLRGADLRGANLRYANLRGAALYDANLRGANLNGADLSGASLYGANLRGVNLRDAALCGAQISSTCLIDGGERSDGYRFIGHYVEAHLHILAGCRFFPIAEAREHWTRTRGGTLLGEESLARCDLIERIAIARLRAEGA